MLTLLNKMLFQVDYHIKLYDLHLKKSLMSN